MNGWNKLLENIKNILKKANINNEYEIEYLTTYECEKKLVKNSLVYFHGHIYKVTKIGYIENNKLEPLDEFNFVNGAELVDILNPNNKGIRTFKYLSNGTVYLIKFNNKLKNITESIYYKDLAFNNAFNKFEELIVLKNPSVEWIKNELTKNDLRFIYNPDINTLYIWNGSKWMHSEVMDNVDLKLSSNINIIGVFSPNLIEVWSEISPNDDKDEAIMLSKKYAGKLFKSIYPFGYQIIAYS